jgi:hypothetical protein
MDSVVESGTRIVSNILSMPSKLASDRRNTEDRSFSLPRSTKWCCTSTPTWRDNRLCEALSVQP